MPDELLASDKFTVRVIKSLAGAPLNQWSNSYEFTAVDPVGLADLRNAGLACVLFEKAIHLGDVRFNRLLISTWVPDSVPYDPSAFISDVLTGSGESGAAGDPCALNVCLSVARLPTTGRSGHLFYRRCLTEEDINAAAGVTVLEDPDGQNDNVQAALTSSELDVYLGNPSASVLQLAMIDKTASIVRNVTALVAQGVVTLPTDHAWFNRTPAGPPE